MKKNILFLAFVTFLITSCAPPDHSHDGRYEGLMSTWIVDGNELTMFTLNVKAIANIRFEGNTAYIGSGNVQQVYRIEYDSDSTKMFVAGGGLARIEMKQVANEH